MRCCATRLVTLDDCVDTSQAGMSTPGGTGLLRPWMAGVTWALGNGRPARLLGCRLVLAMMERRGHRPSPAPD